MPLSCMKSHQSCHHLLSPHTLKMWVVVGGIAAIWQARRLECKDSWLNLKSGLHAKVEKAWGAGLNPPLSKFGKVIIGRGRCLYSSQTSHPSQEICDSRCTSAFLLGLTTTMSLSLHANVNYHPKGHVWLCLVKWMPHHSQNSELALKQTGCLYRVTINTFP